MPELLTKHPDETLSALKAAGARCGEAVAPKILKQCPAERFCTTPGGSELCVYGLNQARTMTQLSSADFADLAPTRAVEPWVGLAISGALLVGFAIGRRRKAPAPPSS